MSTIRHVLARYLVRRNAQGGLPVYTDVRNGGTRHLIHIRNVEGHVDDLARDLRQSRFSVTVKHQRHLVLSGGGGKRDVVAWLTAKGF